MSGAMASAIAGVAMTAFGRRDESFVELAVEAGRAAMDASDAGPGEIDAFVLGTFAASTLGRQGFAAAVVADRLGLRGIPALTVEAACASGGVALRQALLGLETDSARSVLVVGAEKMTGSDTAVVTEVLARATDVGSDGFKAGLTFPGFFALIARAYLAEYGVDEAELAEVSVKNRANGAANPHAQFRSAVTREEALASRSIAEPLRLYDCSPISDGAAAVVVGSDDWVRDHAEMPVAVLASEQATGPAAADRLESFTSIPAAKAAVRTAYERAGLGPSDIDVAEVHDCFTIAEWVALEDLGFVEAGGAAAATARGDTALTGRLPVNASGGLLSKGHPVGATGVAQLVELAEQLRGEAANQVAGAEIGLAHNVGGTGGIASVTILGRTR
jgi:acetyl-CoA C-acetyltransferase